MNRERIAHLEEEYLAEHEAGTVEPFVYEDLTDLENGQGDFPFPVITDKLLSEDWEKADQMWFVDASGFGTEGELALTADAFGKQLLEYLRQHPDHGFGLSGVGQFQVYVSAYRRRV